MNERNEYTISQFIQEQLVRRNMDEVTAIEAAGWLDQAGILRDSRHRPGLPLRNLLRAKRIQGQRPEVVRGCGRMGCISMSTKTRGHVSCLSAVWCIPSSSYLRRAGMVGIALVVSARALAELPSHPSGPSTMPTTKEDPLGRLVKPEVRQRLGFDRLTGEERDAVALMLTQLIDEAEAGKAASAYLRSQWFELAPVSGVQRIRVSEQDIERNWLVVDLTLWGKWAIEPPPTWTEPAGRYWVKPGIDGVDEIIDSHGQKHQTIFGRKKKLR